MTLTKRDYEDALFAWEWGACNGMALVNSLQRVMSKMDNMGTDQRNKHPITRLYLAQLAFLAGIGIGDENGAAQEVRQILTDWSAELEVGHGV